jgi:hypothetical protein
MRSASVLFTILLCALGFIHGSTQQSPYYPPRSPPPTIPASVYYNGQQPQQQVKTSAYYQVDVRCPEPKGLFPHPYDCTRFLNCDFNVPHVTNCPAALHFNKILKVCDWPHQAGCKLLNPGGGVEDNYREPEDTGPLLDLRLQQQKGSPLPKPPSHPRVQRSDVDVSPKRNQTSEARQGWPWTTGILKPVTNAETRGWPFVQGSLVSSKPTRDSEKIGQQESSDRASSGWPFVGQQQNRSQGVNSGRMGWPFVASQP